MKPPTERQLDVLRFIARYTADHGYAPSNRDIGHGIGVRSQNGVSQHLDLLADKGLLTRDYYTRRSTRLTDAGRKAIES